jgi:hypothetical protein
MSEEFRPGLEGVVVAETRLSYINGETGTLRVGGFPIAELAQDATYEMSVYLLLYGHPPTATELADFRERLAGERRLPEEVHDLLRAAAAAALPAMDAIRMGAAAANLGRDTEDDHAEARRIIACFPTIVAAYWRYRQGEDPVAPREDLGHTANYLYMLTGSEPTETAVQGLETYLNTVIDHGLNASTFSARVAVSTESDLVSAATAAVSTLKRPLHGGAPGPVLEMIRDVHASGDPEEYVREVLDAGQRLMASDTVSTAFATPVRRYSRPRPSSSSRQVVTPTFSGQPAGSRPSPPNCSPNTSLITELRPMSSSTLRYCSTASVSRRSCSRPPSRLHALVDGWPTPSNSEPTIDLSGQPHATSVKSAALGRHSLSRR